jgi:hypothetical protein
MQQGSNGTTTGRWLGGAVLARAVRRLGTPVARRVDRVRGRFTGPARDAGMATAEYAIVMIAAVGFAGLLVVILRSAEIREALTTLVRGALSV